MLFYSKLHLNIYGNLYLQSQKNLGVITVSSGNFAVALAYQGNSLGIPVTVLLPESTSPVKIRMCERFDADTRISRTDEEKVLNMFLVSCFLYQSCTTATNFKLSAVIGKNIVSSVVSVFFMQNATEIKHLFLSQCVW